ncbi:hypothetical protein [Streptomyces sp. NPDC004532]
MTAPNDPSDIDLLSSNPSAARLIGAFRDALIRMRDGEDLTVEDLNTATDLLQMVQTTTGGSPAAAVMPLFREVFQGGRDGHTFSEESTIPSTSRPAPYRCVLRNPEPQWW